MDLTVAEGTISVTRTAYGQEVSRDDKVAVPIFGTTPAMVTVEGSVTKNLGDYNSCRVACTVTVPAYPEESEIVRAKTFASEMVDRFIAEELELAGVTPR